MSENFNQGNQSSEIHQDQGQVLSPSIRQRIGAFSADIEKLKDPLDPADVMWRAAENKVFNNSIRVLCYIDVRVVQDTLDRCVGPANWKVEMHQTQDGAGMMAGISIFVNRGQTGEWVTKWDGADRKTVIREDYQYQGQTKTRESKLEGLPSIAIPALGNSFSAVDIKGAISDSVKRAAVSWGIGRELYQVGQTYAPVSEQWFRGAHKVFANGKEYYWGDPDYEKVRSTVGNNAPQPAPQQQSRPSENYQPQQQSYQTPQSQGQQPRQSSQGSFDTSRDLVCPKCKEKRLVPSNRGTGYFCHGCRKSSTDQEYQASIGTASASTGNAGLVYDANGPRSSVPQTIDEVDVPF